MARNFSIQVLRGAQASLPADLKMGEMYFATDTGSLFFGTPGFGLGYVQIGDTQGMNETLGKILLELRAMRAALVALACDGDRRKAADFEAENAEIPMGQEN